MSKRNIVFLLEDIIECIEKIESYTASSTFDGFKDNSMIEDAVVRNLEVIGEAARNVSQDTQDLYPDIPWKQMIGLRNRVIHQYFGVDSEIIWQIVTQELLPLKEKINLVRQSV